METRTWILDHCARYPALQVQDLRKALFQSAFGCEHLLKDPSAAAEYIRREAVVSRDHGEPTVEQMDGAYCRVHLDWVHRGLSPETLARLLVLSARPRAEGAAGLAEKLKVLRALLQEGTLPFDPETAETELVRWEAEGFPACHHSEAFRNAYAPAYRLLDAAYTPFLPEFLKIDRSGNRSAGVLPEELRRAVYENK